MLLFVDMQRWWRTHPVRAQATFEAAHARWSIDAPDGRWRAVQDTGRVVDPWLGRQVTLLDFIEEVPVMTKARRKELEAPVWSWRRPGSRAVEG